jgi:hypothetical protein
MAWPSGTKASTANVDAGTDSITSARADIKQNFDNVNEIIDHLNISSPNDGDLLQYSNSSGKWEQVASSSVGSSAPEMAFARVINSVGENVSGSIYRRLVALYEDVSWLSQSGTTGAGITSRGGNSTSYAQMTLDAGTYIFQIIGQPGAAQDGEQSHSFYNETDATSISAGAVWGSYNEIGTTGEGYYPGTYRFTLAAQKTISIRIETTLSENRDVFFDFNIYKTA